MISRIVPSDKYYGHVILEWQIHSTDKCVEWVPRLKFEENPTTSVTVNEMNTILDIVTQPDSIFTKKFIVCTLSRDCKRTIAGNSYKITGPPRYDNNTDEKDDSGQQQQQQQQQQIVRVEKRENLDLSTIQTILCDEFSIPTEETLTLDLEKSTRKESAEIWSHM
jgi:hypothetical protein